MYTTTAAVSFDHAQNTAHRLYLLLLYFITGRPTPQLDFGLGNFQFFSIFGGGKKDAGSKNDGKKNFEVKKEEEKITTSTDSYLEGKFTDATNTYLLSKFRKEIEKEELQARTKQETERALYLAHLLVEIDEKKAAFDAGTLKQIYLPGDFMNVIEFNVGSLKKLMKFIKYRPKDEHGKEDIASLKYFQLRYIELHGELHRLQQNFPLFFKYAEEITAYKPNV
jgi:hypothetical protein